ncbi:MAG: cupredoxin family copper-binding protein [Candidatus Eremiobacteraeota bacterium]|nr:cupredoxin family copper-binding protein [Candidatus Eremiobacteraeota bacterium]
MKTFTRGFVLSAIAAGALIGTVANFAVADSAAVQSPTPAASPYVVTIKNFAFAPSQLTIPVGATVVWKNQDSVAHTATSTAKGFDSGDLSGGKSFTFTFTKSGSYSYICSYHPSMTGMIIVEPPPSLAPAN